MSDCGQILSVSVFVSGMALSQVMSDTCEQWWVDVTFVQGECLSQHQM